MSEIASTVAKTVGVSTGVYGLTFNEWIALGGFTIAIISVVADIIFKRKRLQLMKKYGEPRRRKADKEGDL